MAEHQAFSFSCLALLFGLLFVASHAAAAVHVKPRSDRRISSHRVRAHERAVRHGRSVRRGKKLQRSSSSTLGTVLFDGSSLTSWWLNQSAIPGRVQMVADPDGAANTAQQFTTYNTDVYPLTPTANPRSQLCYPDISAQAR